MLPGLRFVLAASLLAVSMLVFGMGAIALLRASHQQVANLSAQAVPEPVFAQAPQTVPTLSVLRVEPQPEETTAIAENAGRVAALTTAVREPEPEPAAVVLPEPPPVLAEPQPPAPVLETRSDVVSGPETVVPETSPASAPIGSVAANPELQPPATLPAAADITGSTPSPAPTEAARAPANNPPLPQARPQAVGPVAALTPGAGEVLKVTAAKKTRVIKRRQVRRARTQIAPAVSSNPFGALFGSTSN